MLEGERSKEREEGPWRGDVMFPTRSTACARPRGFSNGGALGASRAPPRRRSGSRRVRARAAGASLVCPRCGSLRCEFLPGDRPSQVHGPVQELSFGKSAAFMTGRASPRYRWKNTAKSAILLACSGNRSQARVHL